MTATLPSPTPARRAAQLLLGETGGIHAVVAHRPAFTAAETARAMGLPEEQTAKVVVLRDAGTWLAVIVPACERVDLAKVRDTLASSAGLWPAAEAEIAAHFPEFEVGAVPPTAGFDRVVLDQRLLTYSRVVCATGDHEHSAIVDPEAIVRATGALVADVSL